MTHCIRTWRCKNPVHPDPCWHARCECGIASAFDWTEEEAREIVEEAHHEQEAAS